MPKHPDKAQRDLDAKLDAAWDRQQAIEGRPHRRAYEQPTKREDNPYGALADRLAGVYVRELEHQGGHADDLPEHHYSCLVALAAFVIRGEDEVGL